MKIVDFGSPPGGTAVQKTAAFKSVCCFQIAKRYLDGVDLVGKVTIKLLLAGNR